MNNFPVSSESQWTDPQILTKQTHSGFYPIEAMPQIMRAAIVETYDYAQTPVPVIATYALTALSLAAQHSAEVSYDGKSFSPLGLSLLVIAESKSICSDLFMTEFRRFQCDRQHAGVSDMAQYGAAMDIWKATYDSLRSEVKAKIKKKEDPGELRDSLYKQHLAKPKMPKVPHLIHTELSDTVIHNLIEKWPSTVVLADDGSSFLDHASLKGTSARVKILSTLKKIWEGSPFDFDQRNSGRLIVEKPRLTSCVVIKESVVRTHLARKSELMFGADYCDYSLVTGMEQVPMARVHKELPLLMSDLYAFNQRIAELLKLPFTLDLHGTLKPVGISFSGPARGLAIDFFNEVETQTNIDGKYYQVSGFVSKLPENVARVAALFHIFEGRDGRIEVDIVNRAIAICRWYLDEALRFFLDFSLPKELSDVVRVENFLLRRFDGDSQFAMTKHILRRDGPVRDLKRLERSLRELVDMDRIRVVEQGRSEIIELNPKIRGFGLL